MTTSWAWLALVAMATLAHQAVTGVAEAIQFYPDHDTEMSAQGYGVRNGSDNVHHCPARCRCGMRTFLSETAIVRPLFTVNCSSRGLVEFPRDLSNETEVLDMSGNKLQNLTALPRLARLRVLDVSKNWLRLLDNHWIFEHVTGLRALSLCDNALKEIQHGTFSGLGQLRELDLSRNILQRLEVHAFAGLNNLHTLHLEHNQLYTLLREWFLILTSLTSLYLGHNHINDLQDNALDPLSRLQHLDLSHNYLRMLRREAMAGLSNLKLLDLTGNSRLQEVPGKSLNSLPKLDIFLVDDSGINRLPGLAFSGLRVAEVSLSFLPKLRVVESAAFYNLTLLRTLQIHDNPRLVYLHPHAFVGLPRLRHLLLHNNGLVSVPGQLVTSLPALIDLHLHHNPLHCDCNIYWLRQELGRVPQHRHHTPPTVHTGGHDDASSITTSTLSSTTITNTPALSSSTQSSLQTPSPQSVSNTTSTNSTPTSIATTVAHSTASINAKTIVSEPGRVTCYFPSSSGGQSSVPLVQLPLEYFPSTCPPSTLPLFPKHINVTLGSQLWLECQGLGVPQPRISWILPGGLEVNGSTRIDPHSSSIHPDGNGFTVGGSSRTNDKGVGKGTNSQWDGTASIRSSVKIVEETLLYIASVGLDDGGRYGCRAVSEMGQDFGSTLINVQNQPLELTEVEVSDDFITVAWRGNIPRTQMQDFQLYYRQAQPSTVVHLGLSKYSENIKSGSNSKVTAPYAYYENGAVKSSKSIDEVGRAPSTYKVIVLHGSVHRSTISGLQADTVYELCLVYKRHLTVECHNYTTSRDVQVVATTSGGITRVSGTQVGVGISAGVGAVITMTLIFILVARRMRHHKDYRDPLGADKSGIPLEGLVTPIVPSTPLTSSRTALLTNSQI